MIKNPTETEVTKSEGGAFPAHQWGLAQEPECWEHNIAATMGRPEIFEIEDTVCNLEVEACNLDFASGRTRQQESSRVGSPNAPSAIGFFIFTTTINDERWNDW